MHKKNWSYFYGSFAITLACLPLGFYLDGFRGVYTVVILGILEASLSLDNAVVNAAVLENWDLKWRNLFLKIGLPIAVFGMRLVFPIGIVAFTTGIGSVDVLTMAMSRPYDYAAALKAVHHQVAAFGGAFLLMVALEFFVNQEKGEHWLAWLEAPLKKAGEIRLIEAGVTLIVILVTGKFLAHGHASQFVTAGVYGVITYIFAKGLGSLLSDGENSGFVKQGVAGLLYLEILDASFSFDGVIGAFAVSNNLFIIATGLGIGAMFVRSLTIYLVDKGTLAELKYLEHGAFWAIGVLAVMMFLGVHIEIPEWITGLSGALLIGLSFWHSVQTNKGAIEEAQ